MGLLDLEQQLIFYGSYHSNRINVLCHVVCVPLILWSALVLTSGIPAVADVQAFGTTLQLGVPFCAACFYSFYYLLLEPGAGILLAPILFALSSSASYFFRHYDNAVQVAVAINVLSWAAQVITHQVFERRSPALLDNFVQALLQAPLFVFLEVLFAFGYRPALQKRIRNQVGINVTRHRRAAAAKQRQTVAADKLD